MLDLDINFSEYINDVVRILILLDTMKDQKSVNVTENKVKLYDYYLKFPYTMLGDVIKDYKINCNFDEYYAFFHWQPNLIRYRQNLNYLLAKGFIEKIQEDSNTFFRIKDLGSEVLSKIDNAYKEKMVEVAKTFLPNIIKLSDSKIEEQIREKTNILLRNGVVRSEG